MEELASLLLAPDGGGGGLLPQSDGRWAPWRGAGADQPPAPPPGAATEFGHWGQDVDVPVGFHACNTAVVSCIFATGSPPGAAAVFRHWARMLMCLCDVPESGRLSCSFANNAGYSQTSHQPCCLARRVNVLQYNASKAGPELGIGA